MRCQLKIKTNMEFSLASKQALVSINFRRNTTYNHYKPAQLKCLKYAQTSDTLGTLPTGYGKSLIFESLPYLLSSAIIVITPLNSIITEQIQRYGEDAVKFDEAFIQNNSTGMNNNIKYIIGHPENFISKRAFSFLRNSTWHSKISNIVIDEAHCVSQWGDGFREKFLELVKLRSLFPRAKILALTATATTKMQKEIIDLLGMKDCKIVQGNVDRSNIKIEVKRRPAGCRGKTNVEDSYDFVFNPLINDLYSKGKQFPKTVVYSKLKWCGYGYEMGHRLRTEDNDVTKLVGQYHSPCTTQMRHKILNSMADPNGETKLLFATEAYSMGTDAPDIRRVVHAGVPGRLETYIQEIGRAGRDGLLATATMFFNMTDISKSAKGMTDEMRNFCLLETCRRDYICQHFGFSGGSDVFELKHDCCDNCERQCECESCADKLIMSVDEEVSCCSSKKQLNITLKEQLEETLREYFEAENELMDVPNAELITGLSSVFIKEICSEYTLYTDTNTIIRTHSNVTQQIADNIALIVTEICLK